MKRLMRWTLLSNVLRRIGASWLVVVANKIRQRASIHQALMPTANPHRHEEKVFHNRPLLRRVLDPFSKRPVVENFQIGSRSIAAVRTRFHPQIWRKRHLFCDEFTDFNDLDAGISTVKLL